MPRAERPNSRAAALPRVESELLAFLYPGRHYSHRQLDLWRQPAIRVQSSLWRVWPLRNSLRLCRPLSRVDDVRLLTSSAPRWHYCHPVHALSPGGQCRCFTDTPLCRGAIYVTFRGPPFRWHPRWLSGRHPWWNSWWHAWWSVEGSPWGSPWRCPWGCSRRYPRGGSDRRACHSIPRKPHRVIRARWPSRIPE